MTYQKFLKEIDRIARKYERHLYVYQFKFSIFVKDENDETWVRISTTDVAEMNIVLPQFTLLNQELKIELFKACAQLASTPPGLREEKYIVPLPNLITTDGEQQYITERGGRWFACRRTEHLRQTWTKGQLYQIPKEYRDYAVEVEE